MELLLVLVVVLSGALAAGGAISYVTRRDRRSSPSVLDSPTVPPRPVRPAPDAAPPGPIPANRVGSSGRPALVPDPEPRAAGAHDAAQRPTSPADGQEDADAAREALRANQRAMSDPRLSTLDRVQALMASQAFALHLTDQLAEPPENDKRDPRDQRESL